MKRKAVLLGVATGLINGIFGGGGGMVVVPLLREAGLAEKEAHATAIFVMLPVSLAGSIGYLVKGWPDWNLLLPCTLGIVLGGILGSRLLGCLSTQAIGYLFAALMLFAGVRMVL